MTTPETPDPIRDALEARANRGAEQGAAVVVASAASTEASVTSLPTLSVDDRRRRRALRTRFAAAAIVVAVLAVGLMTFRARVDLSLSTGDDPPPTNPAAASEWAELAGTLPTDQKFWSATPIWTGSEVLLPGLLIDPTDNHFTQIPAWNPVTGQARLISAPPVRMYPWLTPGVTVVWTGTEMIMFGDGTSRKGGEGPAQGPSIGGVAYNPSTDRWRVTAPPTQYSGLESLDHADVAVWANGLVLVYSRTGVFTYDPVADTWGRFTAGAGGEDQPSADAILIWDGTDLVSFGGGRAWALDGAVTPQSYRRWRHLADPPFDVSSATAAPRTLIYHAGRVAAYDKASNAWTEKASAPFADATSSRSDDTVTWTGSGLVVAGGTKYDYSPSSAPSRPVNDGAIYDLAGDRWSRIPDLPTAVIGRVNPINQAVQERVGSGIWAGDRLVMFGLRNHVGGPNAVGGTLFAVIWKPGPSISGPTTPSASSPSRGTSTTLFRASTSSSTSTSTSGRTPTDKPTQPTIDDFPAPGDGLNDETKQRIAAALVGLTESEATTLASGRGWAVRVVERDGVSLPVYMDSRPDRLNFAIVAGRVTAVTYF